MPTRIVRSLIAAAVAAFLMAAGVPSPLADLEGRSRVLIFFVPDERAPGLEDQLTRLEPYQSAFEQRNIVPVVVIGADRVEDLSGHHEFQDTAALTLRDRFGVKTDAAYAGFLVGLDGRLLWQDNQPVSMAEIITILGGR